MKNYLKLTLGKPFFFRNLMYLPEVLVNYLILKESKNKRINILFKTFQMISITF